MPTITSRTDLTNYVTTALGDFTGDFDIDAIVEELAAAHVDYGTTTAALLDEIDLYAIAQRHETTTTTITEALNDYTGDNIWQDVILTLDSYDETATDSIDRGQSDRFVAHGITYVWDGQRGTWDTE